MVHMMLSVDTSAQSQQFAAACAISVVGMTAAMLSAARRGTTETSSSRSTTVGGVIVVGVGGVSVVGVGVGGVSVVGVGVGVGVGVVKPPNTMSASSRNINRTC